jgi:RHS repeat-associated protein
VQELSYGQDYAGNLTSITDTLDSTRNESFGVDDLNRLHTASGKYGSYTYTYDSNSNLATKYDGTTTYTTTNVTSSNLPDHLTDGTNTRHFTWTTNGNMASDDRTFVGGGSMADTYGGRNLLESMTVNSQSITYKLNAFGQRVSEAFSGNTTHYIHDIRGNVIAEADGSTGTTTVEYVWMEGELLAEIDGSGNIVYVHNNQVGAPQKITNPSRTLVWDQIIKPFGEVYSTPTSTTPTNWRFPGQYANANNSLSHNGARDYDSSGPFYIESDPIGLAGGLNPISYAAQNPTHWTDPTGEAVPLPAGLACLADPWCVGAVLGGAILMSPAGQKALQSAAAAIGQMCEPNEDPPWKLYHGTSVDSGLALLNGTPLDATTAASQKIDGPPGFYLSSSPNDAEFFAARRNGTTLQYTISNSAMDTLRSQGATVTPIPAGKTTTFEGMQFVIPPSAFSTFNALQSSGQISVTPYNSSH